MAGNSVNQQDPKPLIQGEQPTKTLVFRDFGGINTKSPPESIGDSQFSWLENAMPIGPGNLPVLYLAGTPIGGFAGSIGGWTNVVPTYYATASFNGNDYLFALFPGFGLYQMNVATGAVTAIDTSGLFSAQMQITQWNNQGILIIDPNVGYYDWNVTNINTLTSLAGGAAGEVNTIKMTNNGSNYTSPPSVTLTGGSPTTNATAYANLQATAVSIVNAGGGSPSNPNPGPEYSIGDTISVIGGSYTTPVTLQVTQVNRYFGITGVKIINGGNYSSIPSNAVSVSFGSATFNITWNVGSVTIANGGAGYTTTAPSVNFSGGGGSGAAATATIGNAAGAQIGNCIATYAGRVWIANGRTVTYTDVSSYTSFAGAGGSFTISDSTLHKNITALFAANGYLYIFGDDSIDILSNVQVQTTGGVSTTSFSRVNLTTSVGTTSKVSVFSYLRALIFANNTGFYALAGSSPEKISTELDGILPAIDFTKPVYGSPVEINGILCAGFSFYLNDTFTIYAPIRRAILAYYFDKKWFLAYQSQLSNAVLSVPVNGVYTDYLLDFTGTVYPCFTSKTAAPTIINTKLWDDGEPILDKQVIQGGLGAMYQANNNVQFSIQTEYATYPVNLSLTNQFNTIWINNARQPVLWQNTTPSIVAWTNITFPTYAFAQGTADAANGKFAGINLYLPTGSPMTIEYLALQYKTGNRW